jgi:RNA recognition motif-containing protein
MFKTLPSLICIILVLSFNAAVYSFVTRLIFNKYARLKSALSSDVIDEFYTDVTSSKIFIGNLPFTSTTEDLLDLVAQCVDENIKVVNVQIARGKKSKAHRGFAFIDFEDHETAVFVADSLDGVLYEDRVLNCNVKSENNAPVMKKRKPIVENSIFLANLPSTFDEVIVGEMCEDILGGQMVRGITMPLDRITKKRRGIAIIEFYDSENAQRAVKEFDGLSVLDRLLFCEMMKEQRYLKKEEKKKE